jgi:hypothetical protein
VYDIRAAGAEPLRGCFVKGNPNLKAIKQPQTRRHKQNHAAL